MRRLFGLCVIALGIWAAAEMYEKGSSNAFGGILVSSDTARNTGTSARRAADAFQRAYDTSEQRVDRLLAKQSK